MTSEPPFYLPAEGIGPTAVCYECGSLVVDEEPHTMFHELIDRISKQALNDH